MKQYILIILSAVLSLASFAPGATITVDWAGGGDYTAIQTAIGNAANNDVIIVGAGTYIEDIDFLGKAITVRSGDITNPGNLNVDAVNTTISGTGTTSVVTFRTNEDSSSVLKGFTISDGYAYYGGAIECDGASPIISNCIITFNMAVFGGAIDCYFASPLIQNCTIEYNDASVDGIIECGNESSPIIFNCLITNNTAYFNGGAIDCYDLSSPEITNCTITENSSGIYAAEPSCLPVVTNSIVWNNSGDEINGAIVNFSCISGGYTGTNNISSDPLFRTGPLSDYYLSQTAAEQIGQSLSVDSGTGTFSSVFGASDFLTTRTDNGPDDVNGTVDMGYHYPDGGTVINYTLTTNVIDDPNGNGSVDPNQPTIHKQFAEALLEAHPDQNYEVEYWLNTDDDSHTDPFNLVTMNADKTVSVKFKSQILYELTTAVTGGNGTITPAYPDANDPNANVIAEGATVNITASPDTWYRVKEWREADIDQYNSNDPNTYTSVLTDSNSYNATIDSNTLVTVEFEISPGAILYRLDSRVVDANGTVFPKRNDYLAGTTVDVNATPDLNYKVKEWKMGDAATFNPGNPATYTLVPGPISLLSVTMDADKIVTVEFEEKLKFDLTVITINQPIDPDFSVTYDPNGGAYYEGESVTITAHPAIGYEVLDWMDGNSVTFDVNDPNTFTSTPGPSNVYTIVMDANTTVGVEFQAGITVDSGGTITRYVTIQAAIDAATTAGDDVNIPDGNWIGPGNYDLHFNDISITVRSANGPNNCIIDCNGLGRGFTFPSPTDPNLNGIQYIVEGFTIINGQADTGGALLCEPNAAPMVDNCVISNCYATTNGGAAYFDSVPSEGTDPNVPVISNCKITNNTTDGSGGGVFCTNASPIIRSTEITGNFALWHGGGASCQAGSAAAFVNCLVVNNTSSNGYGAFHIDASDTIISLCTIVGNSGNFIDTADNGTPIRIGGIYNNVDATGAPVISNCIIGNNGPGGGWVGTTYYGDDLRDVTANYSCIENTEDRDAGEGNTSNDPLFTLGPLGVYYLSQTQGGQAANSSCFNAGENQNILGTHQTDHGLEVNLTTASLPGIYDTGIVDMGYHYPFDFSVFTYTLTLAVIGGNGGLVADDEIVTYATPGTYTFNPGTNLNLLASPNPSYRVLQWTDTDNDSSFSVNNSVQMYGDRNVTVEFELIFERTIHVPGDWPGIGIQQAIDQARDGDTIVIAPGNYTSQFGYIISGKNITLTSTDPNDANVVAATVIDGTNVSWTYGLTVIGTGNGSCVINGLTINNTRYTVLPGTVGSDPGSNGGDGNPALGNALEILGDHTIVNCVIQNCSNRGGFGASGIAGDDTIKGGWGGDGGDAAAAGILIWGGSPHISNTLIQDCTVTAGNAGNGANGGDKTSGGDGGVPGKAYGAGIYCRNGSPTFEKVTVKNCRVIGGNGGDGGDATGSAGSGGFGGLTYVDTAQEPPIDHSANGGAVYVGNGVTATFIDCTFIDNSTDGSVSGQGGMSFGGSQNFPHDNHNIPSYGGGVYGADSSTMIFTRCTVQNNLTTYHDGINGNDPNNVEYYTGYGGGICLEGNLYAELTDCNIAGNSSSVGAGLFARDINDMHIADSNFQTNTSYIGGGIFIIDTDFATIRNCQIRNNIAAVGVDVNAPGNLSGLGSADEVLFGSGAGIYSFTTDAQISDCAVTDNIANGSGAGIYLGGHPDSISPSTALPNVTNCLIAGNTAGKDGGGISVNWYAEANITNCTIADNTVTGGLDNSGTGGGLNCSYDSNTVVVNTIIWDNFADYGEQLAIETTSAPAWVEVKYSDVQGARAGIYIEGGILDWDPNTNIYADPLFVTGPLDDYYLSHADINDANQVVDSPAIDAGNALARTVLLDYTTRTDKVLDKSVVDLGYHRAADQIDKCRRCDLVFDGSINLNDYVIVALEWLEQGCNDANGWCGGADFNFDTVVDFSDYVIFADCWRKADVHPPTPDPAAWAIVPYSSSTTVPFSVSMTATEAVDSWGLDVEYLFECVTCANDVNSGWISDPNWTDTGLDPNTEYGYQLRVRDVKPDPNAGNVGGWSSVKYAITGEEAAPPPPTNDTTAPAPDPMTWAIAPYKETSTSVRMVAMTATDASGVEYYFDVNDANGADPNVADSGWVNDPNYIAAGLIAGGSYTFTVQARDKSANQNATGWSSVETVNLSAAPLLTPAIFPDSPPQTGTSGSFWFHHMFADISGIGGDGSQVYIRFVCIEQNAYNTFWEPISAAGTASSSFGTITFANNIIDYDVQVGWGAFFGYQFSWKVCVSYSPVGTGELCSSTITIDPALP